MVKQDVLEEIDGVREWLFGIIDTMPVGNKQVEKKLITAMILLEDAIDIARQEIDKR